MPARQAEKFLEGLGDDPKFLRFQTRMVLSNKITEASVFKVGKTNELATLRTHSRRLRTAFAFVKTVGLILLVAAVAFRIWYAIAPNVILTVAICAAIYLRLRKNNRLCEETSGSIEQLDRDVTEAKEKIAELDAVAGKGIRVIDPATFDSPEVKEKVEA